MNITEVTIEPVDEGDLRAYVSVVFDDCFVVHGLKIIRRPDGGLVITMPSRNVGRGVFLDMAFPVDAETRKWIETTVLRKYVELITADQPHDDSKNKKLH